MIKQIWKKYDKDMSGQLNINEFEKFSKELNLTNKYIKYKNLFTLIDSDNSKTIELNEFIKYFKKFSNGEEVNLLFEEYSEYSVIKKKIIFNSNSIMKFYQEVQKEKIDENEAKLIILSLKIDIPENDLNLINDKLKNMEKLSNEEEMYLDINLEEFKNLIYDKNLNPVIFIDSFEDKDEMNLPLNDYYIFSSHNTYLTGHQIYGSCNADMYSKALLLGCRLVELDVYNGHEDGPVVKHGFTMTGEVLLRDCLRNISKFAFETSEFPVILSIENHCDKENQEKMGLMFNDILKDLFIIKDDTDLFIYPSPEQLKRKFIIKVSKFKYKYK
jgi:Ca2+-binding EF-hand superfamily protein